VAGYSSPEVSALEVFVGMALFGLREVVQSHNLDCLAGEPVSLHGPVWDNKNVVKKRVDVRHFYNYNN
jgi:hypothetical protein